jgi:hypothetical protein
MTRDRLPAELLRQVDPADVDRYARASGWRRLNGFDQRRMTVYERPDLALRQLLVPARQVDDYERALADVIERLAEIEQRPKQEVLNDLLMPPADVLRVAVAGPEADGGLLPLAQASNLLAGLKQTLLASACSVLRPQEYHPRLRLTEAELFLDACRLVPTEPGGFALTLACPLDAVPDETDRTNGEPFTRRVIGLLMRSLQGIIQAVDAGQEQLLIQSPDVNLFSGNLSEALLLMRPGEHRSALVIRVTPARTGSAASVPSEVRLGQDHFSLLGQLTVRLRPGSRGQRELFVGFVEVLRGVPGPDDRPAGEVLVSILRDEEAVQARLHLDADDYAAAGLAHLQHQPVRFEGVLHRGPRLSRIDGVTGFARVERAVTMSAG